MLVRLRFVAELSHRHPVCTAQTLGSEDSFFYFSLFIPHLPLQVVYKTNDDHVTVLGAGVTLHEALAAAEQLKKGTLKESKKIKAKKNNQCQHESIMNRQSD